MFYPEAGCIIPSEAGCIAPSEAGCIVHSEAECFVASEAGCFVIPSAARDKGCPMFVYCDSDRREESHFLTGGQHPHTVEFKNIHSGFFKFIRSIFFCLLHPFISFSLAIALLMYLYSSK